VSIIQIEEQITSVLSSIKDIAKVYDHEPKVLERLPAATIVLRGFQHQGDTFEGREILHNWDYRVYVAMGSDPGKSLSQLKQLVDSIIDAFGQDITLAGTCIRSRLSTGETGEVLDVDKPLYLMSGRIEVLESRIP
jgi:phage gpG-like protein